MTSSAKPGVGSSHITETTGKLADTAYPYVSYAGLFDVMDVDPAGAVVLHTLQLASVPNMVGSVQRRLVSFEDSVEGRVLVLKVENDTTLLGEEGTVVVK